MHKHAKLHGVFFVFILPSSNLFPKQMIRSKPHTLASTPVTPKEKTLWPLTFVRVACSMLACVRSVASFEFVVFKVVCASRKQNLFPNKCSNLNFDFSADSRHAVYFNECTNWHGVLKILTSNFRDFVKIVHVGDIDNRLDNII